MTKAELRAHPEYTFCMDRIKGYRPGFRFTMRYAYIPEAKANALKVVCNDAIDAGYLESVSIGLDINGNFTEETYERTSVKR